MAGRQDELRKKFREQRERERAHERDQDRQDVVTGSVRSGSLRHQDGQRKGGRGREAALPPAHMISKSLALLGEPEPASQRRVDPAPPRWSPRNDAADVALESWQARSLDEHAAVKNAMTEHGVQGAIRVLFEQEDGVRSVLKRHLQQFGDVVTAHAVNHDGASQVGEVAAECRALLTEVSGFGQLMSHRQTELQAEMDKTRRSRPTHGLHPEGHAQKELESLREEVKELKNRERHLMSQVRMISSTGSRERGRDGSASTVPQVAEEMKRLNEEIASLRSQRDTWRTRALAAEARLSSPAASAAALEKREATGGAGVGMDVREGEERSGEAGRKTSLDTAAPGRRGEGSVRTKEVEALEMAVAETPQHSGQLLDATAPLMLDGGWGQLSGGEWARPEESGEDPPKTRKTTSPPVDMNMERSGASASPRGGLRASDKGRGMIGVEGERGHNPGHGQGSSDTSQWFIQAQSSIKVHVGLSLPFAEVNTGRQRAEVKHSLILDILVALKDAGHTLRPALLQVLSIDAMGDDASQGQRAGGTVVTMQLECPGDSGTTPRELLLVLIDQASQPGSVLVSGAVSQYITSIEPAPA